ncbi:MAG: hypothetical protein IE885_06015 [Campylobacterales bacterium]|nr:hypothetical protein [Campylobacterales bacterium]
MKLLRGFGKNYFRLSAIAAYSVAPRLQAEQVSYTRNSCRSIVGETEEEDEDSPPTLQTALLGTPSQPCHCNKFFKHKTRLILLMNHYIPRCPYYTPHYAFRRTGVHPPFLTF